MPKRQRQQRGAAIGDERQGHALGRDQVQVEAMLIERLQAELRQQAGGGQQRRTGCVSFSAATGRAARRRRTGDQDQQADDQAELLAGDREDEVGVRVGQHVLDRALARAAAEQPAVAEGFERACRPGSCRRPPDRGSGRRGCARAGRRSRRRPAPTTPPSTPSRDPDDRQPGHEELRRTTPTRHHDGHAEIGLHHQQRRRPAGTAAIETTSPGNRALGAALREQPGGDHGEGTA